MKKLHLFLMLSVVALVMACSPTVTPTPPPNTGGVLAGTNWKLTSYGPASAQIPVLPVIETALIFGTDGQVSGNMGCNGMGGKYSVSGQSITFGPFTSTRMACEEPRIAQETEALKVFNGTVSFVLAGSTLTITSTDGSSALTFAQVRPR